MKYMGEWRALSARIHGLVEAVKLDAQLRPRGVNDFGGLAFLREQGRQTLKAVAAFGYSSGSEMPGLNDLFGSSLANLDKILTDRPDDPASTQEIRLQHLNEATVKLRSLEVAVTFLLSDRQTGTRSTTERAFQHLRRSIAADPDVRRKWTDALAEGETRCEALGATHLLSHGIFAFKINAEGARTDLVFPEPPPSDVEGFADGLVLTEWKVASNQTDASAKAKAARHQAARYADGALATTELRDRRYLVIVTRESVELPQDMPEDGVTYRHINIVVQPDTPSVAAKRAGRLR